MLVTLRPSYGLLLFVLPVTLFCAAAVTPAQVIYQLDPRSQTEILGLQSDFDGAGLPIFIHEERQSRLMCGGAIVHTDGIWRPVGGGELPLPPDIFANVEDEPASLILVVTGPGRSCPQFIFNISGTPPAGAVDAIEAAAERFTHLFSDCVDIHIKVKFKSMGQNTIGSTSNKFVKYRYDEVRSALLADRDDDDVVILYMPTGDRIDVKYQGTEVKEEKHVYLSRSVAKAIGLISATSTKKDGTFKFNTDFAFDYDPTDGIIGGRMDFQHVVLHELGHLLGFTSGVDFRNKNIENLDLARFSTADCADTYSDFRDNPRTGGEDKQGVGCRTCLPEWGDWRMSTGVGNGDGNQASHWKNDGITGVWVGVMDPTLAPGAQFYSPNTLIEDYLTAADAYAFDFMGWDFEYDDLTPGSFSLSFPADGTTNTLLAGLGLDWTNSANATSYRVRVYPYCFMVDGVTPLIDVETTTSSYFIPAGILQQNTIYCWFVTAENAFGARVSATWSFTTEPPGLVLAPPNFDLAQPANGASGAPLNLQFTWQLIGGDDLAAYRVQIDDEPAFVGDKILDQIQPPPFGREDFVTFQVPDKLLQNNKTYYWRVFAINGRGTRLCESQHRSFTTGAFPPGPFGVLEPEPGMTNVTLTPAIVWQPAWGAAYYRVQVDDDPDFGSPELDLNPVPQTFVEVPPGVLLPDTDYYVRVRGVNAAGPGPVVAPALPFTTRPDPPDPFALEGPGDGEIIFPTRPLLNWEPSAGAAGYLLELDPEVEPLSPHWVRSGVQTAALPPVGLLERGTKYYWRVTAFNGGGQTEGSPPVGKAFHVAATTADIEPDGDRDMVEVRALQLCYAPVALPPLPPICALLDLQPDGRIDWADANPILHALTGP
ncbi:MAG: fibronectin type III domain-containing protein [Phycisphaerales bacterium]|nr:fibronectin type III domain-containing protein [Phycisphaerales bacterium]